MVEGSFNTSLLPFTISSVNISGKSGSTHLPAAGSLLFSTTSVCSLFHDERETYLKFRLNEFEGVTQIAFPENYLENFKINLIYPKPQYKQYINGNIIYTYNAEDAGMVTFYLEPRKTGRIKGSLLVGEKSYTLTHLVYP